MDTFTKLSCGKTCLMVICLLIGVSCVTQTSHLKTDDQASKAPVVPGKKGHEVLIEIPEEQILTVQESEIKEKPLPKTVPVENDSPLTEQESPTKPAQEILDSALEFCQASFDFWDKGDLDNSLDALDQAYSLILKVNASPEDPEILQQKDDLRFTISKRIIECYSSRYTVANGYHKAIPLVMNTHVEKAITLFTVRERNFFLDSYRRSGRYRPAIVKALKEAGLPEELSWLPLIESGFKVRAFSRARALGLWQFIASTGYKFGLKRDRWIDERMDPEKSTRAAIAYLKELHQIFGDWATVLAAYNCGEGAVLKRIRRQRINYLDNFWDLYRELPRETAFYFPKFLAVLHILNDPENYGISLPNVDEEIKSETVKINKEVHLKAVAKHLDVSYASLTRLNPELRYNYTPDGPYALNVPEGKGQLLLAKIDDIPVWRPPYVVHRVRRGETLSVIARRYQASVRSIMAMNGLRSRHYIKIGWKLKIPTGKHPVSAKKTSSSLSGLKIKGGVAAYVVQKGDSLWKIANRFGTKTKTLKYMNQLRSSQLQVGQILKIPIDLISHKKRISKTQKVIKTDKSPVIAGQTIDAPLIGYHLT